MHQRNQIQTKGKFKTNIHMIMVIWPLFNILTTLHPWLYLFLNQTWSTLDTSSKTMSKWTTLLLTRLTRNELTREDFETKWRWPHFGNFANQLQNEHHHHHSLTLFICLRLTKKICKFWPKCSCGHYVEQLAGMFPDWGYTSLSSRF